MSGNALSNIVSSNALQVAVFTADALPAHMTAFSIDMNTGLLRLSFIEPVSLATFRATDVVLSLAPTNGATSFTLSGGSAVIASNDVKVSLLLVPPPLHVYPLASLFFPFLAGD